MLGCRYAAADGCERGSAHTVCVWCCSAGSGRGAGQAVRHAPCKLLQLIVQSMFCSSCFVQLGALLPAGARLAVYAHCCTSKPPAEVGVCVRACCHRCKQGCSCECCCGAHCTEGSVCWGDVCFSCGHCGSGRSMGGLCWLLLVSRLLRMDISV